MSHLWTRMGSNEEWAILPLGRDHRYHLTGKTDAPAKKDPSGRIESGALLVSKGGVAREAGWVLIASGEENAVRVNGSVLGAGIRFLRDKDEVRVKTTRLFFSSEEPARVEAFPGADRPVKCPRCHTQIEKGQLAVRCPQCEVWSHQADDLPCWTYPAHPRCASCGHATGLDAGFQWTPEEIG